MKRPPVARRILRLVIPVAAASLAAIPVAAEAAPGPVVDQQSSFGRMFPTLDAYDGPDDDQALADLAQLMLDPGAPEEEEGEEEEGEEEAIDPLNNPGVPAGFTYLGQFIDHDLTRDQQPSTADLVDPTTLKNFRTFKFDLDSLYGKGPFASPELYDGAKLLVQEPNENGVADLARGVDSTPHSRAPAPAIIGDNRNDENQIISQMHVAFIKFHNRLIDEGHSFSKAQQLTRWHYQWVVVNDYLPHVAGQDRVKRFLKGRTVRNELYNPGRVKGAPMTPVEFSAAIFRYGHSQVRDEYELNEFIDAETGEEEEFTLPVFRLPFGPDLRGGAQLPGTNQIDWSEFFEIDESEVNGNQSRRLDTKISESLYQLPIPGAEAQGSNVLAFRNFLRSKSYGLPSGQDVARAMKITPISNETLGLGPEFKGEAPLWYYMLAESEITEDGERLGPVAGRVVAEVFLSALEQDPKSFLNTNRRFKPTLGEAGEPFDMGQFLKFAGVVEEEEEEEETGPETVLAP